MEPMSQGDRPLRLVPWRAVLRNRWIIIGCTVTILMITMGLTWLAVPVYEGSTTLRIEQKEPNLPEVFRTLSSSETRLGTEVEELRSRTLAAEVVTQLGLQLSLVEPQVRRRSSLFQNVQVTDSARAADYLLIRRDHGRFTLLNDSTRQQLGEFATGERVEFGGFNLVLAATALEHAKSVSASVRSRTSRTVWPIDSAGQPSREVNFVKVSYRSRDQELAWQVPQALGPLHSATAGAADPGNAKHDRLPPTADRHDRDPAGGVGEQAEVISGAVRGDQSGGRINQ